MPVPYMGSKRVSAKSIVNVIRAYYPDIKELYDPFCGGFAISEEAIKHGFNVYASDKNEAIVNLINEVLFGECKDPKTGENIFDNPRFIPREEWHASKDGKDWWAGYLQSCWSFGNKQTTYLFGKNIEHIKKAGHDLVIDKKIDPILEKYIPRKYLEKITTYSDWHKRRLALRKTAVALKGKQGRVLELQQLQQLERLQQLQQLERLQQLQHKSYDEIEYKEDVIIYCDPPYAGTTEYKEDAFDHEKFYNWLKEQSKHNPIFISEYNMPDDFNKIYEFARRQTLQMSGRNMIHTEKVFLIDNRKER